MERYAALYAKGAYLPVAERRRLARLLRGPDVPPPTRISERFEAPAPPRVAPRPSAQETLF
jgi:hypothetical protein